MGKLGHRFISLAVCAAMLLSLCPQGVFASGGGYDAPALTTQSSETNGITDGDSVAYLVYSGEADTAPETKTLPAGEYTLLNDASAPTEWGGETGTEYWYVAEGKVMLPERVNVTGDVHLVLADDCWLDITNEKSGGINVSAGSSLTIYAQSTDEDKMGILVAAGQESCAGIGGGNGQNGGTVTIHGGSVDVMGGKYAAGIGGGDGSSSGGGGGGDGSSSGGGSGGTVMIYGGNVQTTGGSYAAGIGGGMYGSGGSIAIYGGTVTAATSGKGAAAGIGGGDSGSGGTITITGGTVVADGSGAGIGGNADGSDGGSVTITGGTVTATGNNGAGIGGSVSTVTIKGGTVEAKSNSKGVAIGTRDYLAGEMKVYIEAGHVTANGGSSSAGIGNGNGGYASAHVFISGGTVDATGGSFGAGIGGGLSGTGGNTVTITGGTVVATGGDYAAGIGGGYNGKSVAVTISGGIVTATGGSNAAGVGNGESGSGATFSTGTDGHALLVASSISDKDDTSAWSGIIFEGAEGKVYGDVTLPAGEYPVPAGSTLTIPCGSTLTGAGTLTSDGTATFITENLTEDMIRVPDGIVAGDPDLSETLLETLKEEITQDLKKQTVTLCGQDFALSGWTVADVEAKAGDATNRTYTVTCTYDGTPAQTLAAEITLPLSLASATVTLAQDTYTYDGNEKKPSVTVTLADNTPLEEGTDYTVSYANNVSAGTADAENAPTIIVTGMGSYTGEVKKPFTISPAKLATPTGLSWKSGTGYPAAQWNAVENAAENVDHYLVYIYECNADGTRKENVDWVEMAAVRPTESTGADGRESYECVVTQAGKHYTFTVQAVPASNDPNHIASDVVQCGPPTLHEHDWTGTPEWTWEGYTEATAVLTCTECNTVLDTATATIDNGGITSVETAAPTCEGKGVQTYTATVTLNGKNYTNTKTAEIPAAGHTWGDKPSWKWADDHASATATFTCTKDTTHTHTEQAKVEDKSTAATCTTPGQTLYEATVNFNNETYTAQTEPVPIPATGHTWGQPEWSWGENHGSVMGTFTCEHCDATQTVSASGNEITSQTTPATCELDGKTVYSTTVTFNGQTYTPTATVTLPKLNHDWDDGAWTWSKDGKTATLTFTCQREPKHTATPDVTMAVSSTSATCTEAGTITYTATATFNKKTYTEDNEVTGAALGHSWGEPVWKWAEDYSSVTGTFTCERCHTTATASAGGSEITSQTTPATCELDGKIVYSASVTFNNKSYEATAEKTIDKLGHIWSGWAKTAAPTEDAEGEETRTCSVCGETETRPIPALGHTHTWGAPVWSWAAGGESASATFTCTKNEAHTQVIEAEITEIEAERIEPTETAPGQAVYEAAVNFEGQDYTSRKTVRLPATGVLVPDDEKTRLDVQELSDADIPAGLQQTKFNTAKDITEEMTRVLAEEMQTDAANTVVHDVRLQVLQDGDWVDVHEDDFPAGGVVVTLPYPDGTGPQTHTYVVTHMLSSGADAGKVEVLREGERVTKTAEGLRFTVYSLSPIGVAWTEKPAEQPAASGSDGDVEAFIGAAVVIGGGAALLAYHYREDLPIWKLAGVVTLAAADGTADAAGAPVANATVTLYQSGEAVKTLTTDAHGLFETRVPKGTYEAVVTWEKDGVVYTARKEVVAESVLDDGAVQQIALQAAQPQA